MASAVVLPRCPEVKVIQTKVETGQYAVNVRLQRVDQHPVHIAVVTAFRRELLMAVRFIQSRQQHLQHLDVVAVERHQLAAFDVPDTVGHPVHQRSKPAKMTGMNQQRRMVVVTRFVVVYSRRLRAITAVLQPRW